MVLRERRFAFSLLASLTLACGGDGDAGTSANADAETEAGDTGDETGSDTSDPVEIELIQIDTGEWVFDARAAGPEDGDLVLLLHGFPSTSYEWHAQLLALGEAGYRAVAPNQRGYSATARPEGIPPYAADLLVADVLAMADALDAPQFHLAGHDWGSIVAWATGAAAPERVTTLAAMSVPHPDAFAEVLADTRSCQYQASAYFDFFESEGATNIMLANDAALLRDTWSGLSDAAIEDYLSVLGNEAGLDAALNWYRANITDRTLIPPPIGQVTVPTLFVWSDGDDAICQGGADLTTNYVSGPYRYEVLEGIDHWIPENAPEAVSTFLLEHLAEHG